MRPTRPKPTVGCNPSIFEPYRRPEPLWLTLCLPDHYYHTLQSHDSFTRTHPIARDSTDFDSFCSFLSKPSRDTYELACAHESHGAPSQPRAACRRVLFPCICKLAPAISMSSSYQSCPAAPAACADPWVRHVPAAISSQSISILPIFCTVNISRERFVLLLTHELKTHCLHHVVIRLQGQTTCMTCMPRQEMATGGPTQPSARMAPVWWNDTVAYSSQHHRRGRGSICALQPLHNIVQCSSDGTTSAARAGRA